MIIAMLFKLIVGSAGLFGNSISVSVLTQQNMRNSFNLLLVVLILSDNTFILFALMDYACVRGECSSFDSLIDQSQRHNNGFIESSIKCSRGLSLLIVKSMQC